MNDETTPPELRFSIRRSARRRSPAFSPRPRVARAFPRVCAAPIRTAASARGAVARAMRIAFAVLFVLMVAIPNVVSVLYYSLIASDQYVSGSRFVVSSAQIPGIETLGAMVGAPSSMIAQDTVIITNYLASRPLVEQLERQVDLRKLYSASSIDWWARFDENEADREIRRLLDHDGRGEGGAPIGHRRIEGARLHAGGGASGSPMRSSPIARS